MTYTADELWKWLNSIRDYGRGLSDWEEEFCESVRGQLSRRGSLSERQVEILERIYSERTP